LSFDPLRRERHGRAARLHLPWAALIRTHELDGIPAIRAGSPPQHDFPSKCPSWQHSGSPWHPLAASVIGYAAAKTPYVQGFYRQSVQIILICSQSQPRSTEASASAVPRGDHVLFVKQGESAVILLGCDQTTPRASLAASPCPPRLFFTVEETGVDGEGDLTRGVAELARDEVMFARQQ
jgi:hypothetical protein